MGKIKYRTQVNKKQTNIGDFEKVKSKHCKKHDILYVDKCALCEAEQHEG